ncbi:two-component sensor histidine kinase [Anaerocolumna chitinilytica]|uniref:histidine kinase n=2 Tax=Anaerocolumna chitinilytica TaxID=1727145 RepID=A0A7M3S990_9FIRM|nr:two-component sensor histidine kinase [Anaerocolumna chitinilytica]
MDEICGEFIEHLSNKSNTLISISTGDKQIRHFAAELNKQLRLLRKQRQQYLSGDRELNEAVTNISHDLRTPLTAICGYMELLEGEEKSDSVERYLNIISNRVETLKQLTEELFRYSVIITSENDTVKEKVILGEALEESIAGFYAVLKEHGIEPNIQLPQNKVVRYLNPSALSRVLSNLLNNAIKYSDGDLDITLTKAGEIVFTNTASRLNEVQVGKLFDRFYTVEAARESTGLGLAITRTLIEQMNGTISAEYNNKKLSICILLSDSNNETY